MRQVPASCEWSLPALRSNKSPDQQVLHGAIQVAGNKSVIFSFEIRRRLLRIYMNASTKDRKKRKKNIRAHDWLIPLNSHNALCKEKCKKIEKSENGCCTKRIFPTYAIELYSDIGGILHWTWYILTWCVKELPVVARIDVGQSSRVAYVIPWPHFVNQGFYIPKCLVWWVDFKNVSCHFFCWLSRSRSKVKGHGY